MTLVNNKTNLTPEQLAFAGMACSPATQTFMLSNLLAASPRVQAPESLHTPTQRPTATP
jgi:hypothetical protein